MGGRNERSLLREDIQIVSEAPKLALLSEDIVMVLIPEALVLPLAPNPILTKGLFGDALPRQDLRSATGLAPYDIVEYSTSSHPSSHVRLSQCRLT